MLKANVDALEWSMSDHNWIIIFAWVSIETQRISLENRIFDNPETTFLTKLVFFTHKESFSAAESAKNGLLRRIYVNPCGV